MIQRSRFRPKLVMPLASAVFPLFQLETFLQIPEDMWQSLPEAPSTGVRPWQATHVGNASEVARQLSSSDLPPAILSRFEPLAEAVKYGILFEEHLGLSTLQLAQNSMGDFLPVLQSPKRNRELRKVGHSIVHFPRGLWAASVIRNDSVQALQQLAPNLVTVGLDFFKQMMLGGIFLQPRCAEHEGPVQNVFSSIQEIRSS